MNADIFAEWFRRQGYQVVRTESSYWYEASPHVYQAFPYHWIIQPDESELRSLMKQHRAAALRYSTPVESPFGCISYHVVYDQDSYTLEGLDRRSRQNVRNGLSKCNVEQIPIEQLAEEGWALEMDTARRQRRKVTTQREEWRKRYMAASDLPGFEAWGALVEGSLAAALFSFQMEDCCELISQQCHRDYLNARVNNALTFIVTQTIVNRTGYKFIYYTIQSLDAPPSVDEFKFRMGYIARPIRQRIIFHTYCKPFVRPVTYSALLRLRQRIPENHYLAKGEGMIRMYLEGQHPLEKQTWPECLNQSGMKKQENQRIRVGKQGLRTNSSFDQDYHH